MVRGCTEKVRQWDEEMAPLFLACEEEGWVEFEEAEDVEAAELLRRGVQLLKGHVADEELCWALAAVANGPETPHCVTPQSCSHPARHNYCASS